MILIKQGWQVRVTTNTHIIGSEQTNTIYCKTKQDAQFLSAFIDYATNYTDSSTSVDKATTNWAMEIAAMYPNSMIDSNHVYENDILKADIEDLLDDLYYVTVDDEPTEDRYIKSHAVYYIPNEIKIDETKFDKRHSLN